MNEPVTPKPSEPEVDEEVKTLMRCVHALLWHDIAAQQRILRYLVTRFPPTTELAKAEEP